MRILLLLFVFMAVPTCVWAQDTNTRKELRESELRLDQIRQEREQLQREMNALRSRVRNVSAEIANIDRQVAASASAMRELDFQYSTLELSIQETEAQLQDTRSQLTGRRDMLNQRLRSIYKRGPMHAVRVLLAAEDFGNLLNRYRYLHIIALHDQALINDVESLERTLTSQERALRDNFAQLDVLRQEKAMELARLKELDAQKGRTLRGYRAQEKQTEGKLEQLARDEARLKAMMAELERVRLEAERRAAAEGRTVTSGALTTRDMGSLPWPVDGELIYRFGPNRKPNGVVLRHNGVGIAAPVGTTVKAVKGGRVDMARMFEGYGPTVILSHGAGYYTLYHFLGRVTVKEGQQVAAGQAIGTVGGERTPEGAHIEFRVHVPVSNSLPEPVDPIDWLRAEGGR